MAGSGQHFQSSPLPGPPMTSQSVGGTFSQSQASQMSTMQQQPPFTTTAQQPAPQTQGQVTGIDFLSLLYTYFLSYNVCVLTNQDTPVWENDKATQFTRSLLTEENIPFDLCWYSALHILCVFQLSLYSQPEIWGKTMAAFTPFPYFI